MARVIVVGSANIDLVVRALHLPRPGETVPGTSFYMAPGGKGANQAVAAARLGAEVYLVARVGADAFGKEVRESIGGAGVKLDYLREIPDVATGVALITVEEGGQNTIVVALGANDQLTGSDVRAAEEAIAGAQMVMCQLEIPEEAVWEAANLARTHGVPFLLNPAPARRVPAEVLQAVSIITPNETEAEALTGIRVADVPSAQAAGKRLLQAGIQAVVVTMGDKGAVLVTGQETQHFPARKVKAVDATAAGDAFSGALAVALAEGRSLQDAVMFAGAVAAICVTRPGAQPSMPYREEAERLWHSL